MFQTEVRGNHNTHFMFHKFFPKVILFMR